MLAELDDLVVALDGLDRDMNGLDDATLEAVVHRLAGLQTSVQALWLAALAAVEQRSLHRRYGVRDAATWVASVAGDRRGAARRDVELAAQLTAAPLVADAMAAGVLSKAKAAELIRAADLPDDTQRRLVDDAIAAPVERVAAAVQRARFEHGVISPPVTPSLSITRTHDQVKVDATLDLVDGEFLDVAVHAAVDALGLPAEVPIGERRARALGAIARFYLDHHAAVPTTRVGRPHALVIVDIAVLEARSGGSALLGSGAVISGEQARRLSMDANITRVITNGRSEPLDVGRTTRSVPPALAKGVIARDRHCRFGGCAAPWWACDVHHFIPWARHGPTALDNLGLLCWFHHEHVHREGADRLTVAPDGRWTISPRTPEQAAA